MTAPGGSPVPTSGPPPPAASVAVMTDSAASLPAGEAERLGVAVVPMAVVVGDDVYPDGTLDPSEVLRRAALQRVSTSAPSPGAYLAAMEPLGDRPVLLMTVSQKMSSSFESATAAARYRAGPPVLVVDSETAAGGQGLVVLAAARAAASGLSLEEVAARARDVVRRVHLIACLEHLDQLARSGRVPGIAAWAGRSLHVLPMFEFAAGDVRARRPARSAHAAAERMVTTCRADAVPGGRLHAAVLHAQSPAMAEEVEGMVRAVAAASDGHADPGAAVYSAPFSSVMVVHTGPGLCGLAWWWEPPPFEGDARTAGEPETTAALAPHGTRSPVRRPERAETPPA